MEGGDVEVRPSHPFPSRRERRHLNGHRRNSPSLNMADVCPLFSQLSNPCNCPMHNMKDIFPSREAGESCDGHGTSLHSCRYKRWGGEGLSSPFTSPPSSSLHSFLLLHCPAPPIECHCPKGGEKREGGKGNEARHSPKFMREVD